MKRIQSFAVLFILALSSCATIAPGSGFIVRVERTQRVAAATLDFVLSLDEGDRDFWRTNAPAFHDFCEWLRSPSAVTPSLQRGLAIQKSVQDLKVRYKQQTTTQNSNALYLAWAILDSTIIQANSWSNIVTSPIHY